MKKIRASLFYHKGLVRDNQEDNYFFARSIGSNLSSEHLGRKSLVQQGSTLLLGIFDGMGGLTHGEDASYIAANALLHMRKSVWKPVNEKWLKQCIYEMNDQVHLYSMKQGCVLGTTAALLKIGLRKVIVCNVGDSRIYLHRNGILEQLTQDHSDQELLDKIGAQRKASLLQYIGMSNDDLIIEPAITTLKHRPGDRFVLCSDGLTDMVSEEEINEICKGATCTQDCTERLVEKALEYGGIDNVTVIVADIPANQFHQNHLMEGNG